MSFRSKKTTSQCHEEGFTLIELLVSVAIIAIITGIVLSGQARFNSSIFLTNLTYDVALTIRQAQVFGLSVQEFRGSTQTFQIGYGVHFNSGDATSFFIFADLNRDSVYQASSDEIVETFTVTRGNRIADFCATPVGVSATESCVSDSSLNTLDILFLRPDPDAIITTNLSTVPHAQARVVVQGQNGDSRSVYIHATGQISVEQI